MTAAEWKAKTKAAQAARGVELTLPSGMTVKARRPDPMQFAYWKMLPMQLAAAAQRGAPNVSDEEAEEIAGLMRELLIWCCLEPAVSTNPGPAEIHPREISQEDWMYIVGWALRLKEAEQFRPFRGERPDGQPVSDGAAILLQTVESAGDRGPVDRAGVRPGGGEADGGGSQPGA